VNRAVAPIVVGGDGDPTKRGMVPTALYEARTFRVVAARRSSDGSRPDTPQQESRGS
jgi:nucleotidyltransferase/DNA polymerase involved in DNA repair